MGLFGGLGLLTCACAIFFSTRAAAHGTLPRGIGIGIRTAITQHSDQAWVAAHRAALPCASAVSGVAAGIGICLCIAGAVSGSDDPDPLVLVLFAIGYGVVLLAMWPLVRIADNAALDAAARARHLPH